VVASFSPQDVRDLFWAQAQLASELAARAAKTIGAEDIARLEQIDEDFDKAVRAGDNAQIAELGAMFHVVINRAAESHRLALLLESVVSQLPSNFYATIEGHVAATHDAHPQLTEALRKRQVRKVRTLMEQHIMDSADHLITTLEDRGLWSEETA
jgi:DNA-binding GntR family transcriptional regulator